MTRPRILAALAAAFLGLVPVGAGAQTISGGGGVSVPFTASCATVTVSTVCWNVTETWNAAGTTFGAPLQVSVTDTASASGSLAFSVSGGAAGTTNLFKVDKAGAATFGAGSVIGGNVTFSSDAAFDIGASGATRPRDVYIARDLRVTRDIIGSFYVQTGATTLTGAGTCNAGALGERWMINDATVVAAGNFGAAITGGGANTVPAYCDGASWRIG